MFDRDKRNSHYKEPLSKDALALEEPPLALQEPLLAVGV
jgi:hypothetical protein